MRILTLFTFLVMLVLSACSLFHDTKDVSSQKINWEVLDQHWLHSFEEEQNGSEADIYRPHGYKNFPPSRFRMQYIFEKNGHCKWFYLAPNDSHHFKPGKWKQDADDSEVIIIERGGQGIRYRILELNEDILRITRID